MQASQTLAAPVQYGLASVGYAGGAKWMSGAVVNDNVDVDVNVNVNVTVDDVVSVDDHVYVNDYVYDNVHVLDHAAANTTTVILSRASPLASPSMDSTGRAACWVSQRPDAPAARNSEIVCAIGNAPSFATPITITNDSLADASPSVAMAGANAPIAAWWRNSDAALATNTSIDNAYLNKTDVMASAYDPGTSAWSAPVNFGSANATDYDPQVAGNGAGNGLLVWRENTAGQIGGMVSTPDTVKAATYDAGSKTWSAAQNLHSAGGERASVLDASR
jgi:hypothetical protein